MAPSRLSIIVATTLVVACSGSSSGGGSDGTGSSSDPLAAARSQCVQVINMYRATVGSPALTEASASDESCVDGQAQADYTSMTAHSAFGKCMESAQDECPGWPGPPSSIDTSCLAQMWQEGPPPAGQDNHWLNMSNAKYTRVACGFYQVPGQDSWWATQDFW
ncbi:MAG TPA: CAP domain-containing protein [Polyangiaceae bacterium]